MTSSMTVLDKTVYGNKRVITTVFDITGYATGGEEFAPATVGLKSIYGVEVLGQEEPEYRFLPKLTSGGNYDTGSTARLTSGTAAIYIIAGGTAELGNDVDAGVCRLRITGI